MVKKVRLKIQLFFRMKAKRKIKHCEQKILPFLVRGYTEADLVKKELQALGIASVYLSDRGNVFESNTAKELDLILQACLSVTERPNFECHCDRTFSA